jgi:hypothetical protein
MATESLAELATVMAPGYRAEAVQNEKMMGAFKFFRNEPRTLYLQAFAKPGPEGSLVAHGNLSSITPPAREGLPTRVQVHFRADVPLTTAELAAKNVEVDLPDEADLTTLSAEVYETFFHGPTYQVIGRIGVQGRKAIAQIPGDLPANCYPNSARELMAPRLVEACFQAAAQWSIKAKNAMAFPLGFDAVTVYRQENEADGQQLYAVVETADDGESFDGLVIDESGRLYVALSKYRTVSRPGTDS